MDDRHIGMTGTEGPTLERRERWRRTVMIAQGAYYVLAGLWPLVHFSSFSSILAMQVNPFQAQSFGAVLVVVGGNLVEAARREPPGQSPTLLGAAVAGAIAVVSMVWLPRLAGFSGLWVDLVVEVAIAVALVVLYPRTQSVRSPIRHKR